MKLETSKSKKILTEKKIFNPEISNNERRLLIGGKTNNLMILSDNKFKWSFKLYKTMMGNFWIPEEVSLGADKAQYDLLDEEVKDTFDKVISFLVFLDSLQTVNLDNINEFITLPEVNLLITIQQYQEALHSQSYGYILETVVPAERRRKIYDIAITDKFLVKRNKYIADYYQEFKENKSEEGMLLVMMANYILEGLYFYSGFSFFYNLVRSYDAMTGVATSIRYINRDELTHVVLFKNMFLELKKEKPYLFTTEMLDKLRNMMFEGVQHEVEWAEYSIGNKIRGLSTDLIEKYLKHIANSRLEAIGLEPLYEGVEQNPLPFIDQFTKFNQIKTDFFEEKPQNYSKDNGNLDLESFDGDSLDGFFESLDDN
jgi:ribonucleoside-diphosphate reductase beta chain